MKKSLLVLLTALLQLAALAQAQNVGSPEAGGQIPQAMNLQEQAWMKSMTENLQIAIDKKDVASITQIELYYAKHVTMGMEVCGHVIDDGTVFDAVSVNDSHELAMVIRWLDPTSTAIRSAVFTGRKRCVAMDGTAVNGKSIVQVLPNSVALSRQHALVAWEAYYWNSPAEARPGLAPHRGIFIEYVFVAELDPAKASPLGKRELDEKNGDFQWKDDPETIVVKPGLAINPATAQAAKTAANVTAPCPAVKTPSFLDKLKRRAERSLEKEAQKADASIGKATAGAVDGGASDAASSAIAGANSSSGCPPAKGQGK